MVDDVVGRADVERHALSVAFKGNVGEAADIEAEVVVGKEQAVAHGHQRCALSAQHDVQTSEVGHGRDTCLGCDGRPVAYLEHDALLRLVEYGVSVRGDEVGV